MARWLVLAFITVPLVEIFVIVQVGQLIGGWWTVALLFGISLLGGLLVRKEGRRAWIALVDALNTGRMPTRELLDGALILIGGSLMLTPGFVTDAVGLLMLLPPTRPASRRLVTVLVSKRILAGIVYPTRQDPRQGAGPVIPGQVVDSDDEDPDHGDAPR